MTEETFKLTLDFPISALKAFELFVNTSVTALWEEEKYIRNLIMQPGGLDKVDERTKLTKYLEESVIPQQMIASELQRALKVANPEIVI